MTLHGISWNSVSLRKKLIITFLIVSLLPILIMTVIGSSIVYNDLYKARISHNSEGLAWSQERLDHFNNELIGMFYALEINNEFRRTVLNWTRGQQSFSDFNSISKTLVSHLNRHHFLASFELVFPEQSTIITAERAGVRLIHREDVDYDRYAVFTRKNELQTNLFYKLHRNTIVAIHDMRQFEDKELIAQIRVILRPQKLQDILSRIHLLENENVFLLNDEMENIISANDPSSGLQSLHTLIQSDRESKNILSNGIEMAQSGQWIAFSTYNPQRKLSVGKVVSQRDLVRATLPTVYAGLVVGLLSILGAVVATLVFSGIISKPLINLARRVQEVQLHTLVLEPDQQKNDEVSILEHHISMFMQRIRDLIRNEYDISMQAKTAQIQALQAQMNPHFLHNTLQLIGSIALSHNAKDVYTISKALSELMRYSMAFDEREGGMVTVREELKHLENYFLIQKERFRDRITIDSVIDQEVLDCLIPKLLIQPLVENSFQHGFARKTGDWRLNIHAFIDEEHKAHITVRDNGAGIPEQILTDLKTNIQTRNQKDHYIQPLKLKEHIGILNTNDRIRLLFSAGDGLQIRSVEGTFTEVEIVFDARRTDG